ncbi:hypothetical protein LRS73_34140 (plasmid) [Methylobacterium currus]|uniref:delta-60 repeat domain-containing protein n=1 Tax=Methylobacterium currus TaxID=2051553 RepID=UPI001E3D5CF5|nr:delta-60 repeat domain-containing protein [Methylobacterium currus]UHC20011.1 hypothetical protein LRS73_34140 [Methylobacterium currus]
MLITAVNDAPVVTASAGSTSALEQVATAVDAGVSVSDPDNASLASARVAITGGFVRGEDVLGFDNTDATRFGNIAGRYDAATGVLSLTSAGATATTAQFEAALRSVTYLDTSDTPNTGLRTIGMAVNDGALDSPVASRTVSVVPVDDAPTFVLPPTGKVITPVGPGDDYGKSAAVQADGKILLGGFAVTNGTSVFAVVRYSADGSLDTSFGQSGKVTTPIGSTATAAAWSIVPQSDGKILLGGYAWNGKTYDFAIVRYNADGSLDTSFGQGGKVTTPIGSNATARSITIQSDGKILLGGDATVNGNQDFALARYNADGSLDASFGQGGKVTTHIDSASELGRSITIQADGKILLGGIGQTGSGSSAAYGSVLARYNADGSLDTGFGQGGTLVTRVGQGFSDAESVTTQPDGKILLGGWARGETNADFALVRYTAAGVLDTSFGQGGKILTAVGSAADMAYSVTVQADGKILLAGAAYYNSGKDSDFAVVRYNADGSLDTSFGQGGKTIIPAGPGINLATSVQVQSDGKIVLGGQARNAANTNYDFAVVRLNADGSLDTRFGIASSLDGTAPFTEGGTPVVLAPSATLTDPDRGSATYAGGTLSLARQGGANPDDRFSARAGGSLGALTEGGKLVYGGTVLGSVKTNSGGVLTLTFTGGSAAQVSGLLREIAYSNASANPPASVALAWSFAETGVAPSPIGVSQVAIIAVNSPPVVTASSGAVSALEQVATVVDAGVSVSDPDSLNLVSARVAIIGGFVRGEDVLGFDNTDATRFGNITGSYDATTGVLSLTSAGATATMAQFEAALRAVTYLDTSDAPNTRARTIGMSVNDGSLNSPWASRTVNVVPVDDPPTFVLPPTGKVMTPVGTSNDFGQNVMMQPDGKILLAGKASNGKDYDFALVRYTAGGSPDYSFGQGGKVMAPVGSGDDTVYSVTMQPDGKVLLAGYATIDGKNDFALVRYNADGSLDTGFGQGGKVLTLIRQGSAARSVTVQDDGKILLAGFAGDGKDSYFAVARYNIDGSLDTNFGESGTVTAKFDAKNLGFNSIKVQSDGKFLLGGSIYRGEFLNSFGQNSDYDFALMRYNADGSLDTSFGKSGTVTTSLTPGMDQAQSVTVQPDGKILLAGSGGWVYRTQPYQFAMVRYNADGSLDGSFGQGGTVLTPINQFGYNDVAYSVTVQPDGKILLAGSTWTDRNTEPFAVLRYNANGSLDTGFGQGGKALVPVGPSMASAASVTVQPDGRIVIGGYAINSDKTDYDFAVVRLNTDGSLDTGFGTTDTLGGGTPFTEHGAPVVLAPSATLTDPDGVPASYAGATLSLARQGGANADDRFSASAGGSLGPLTEGGKLTYAGTVLGSVKTNSGGVLTLTFTGGSGTQVSKALREIAYANASANPPASVALTWSFAQGSAAPSAIGVSQVTINAVNDAPVVTVSSGSTDALGRTATAVDAGVSVSDPDNASLASATVLITGGFVSGQDVLGFDNTDATRFGNIVSGYDAASGVLSLTSSGSTATLSQFEAALRFVTYLNTSDAPNTGLRTIGMSVNDGSLTSAVATRTVSVVPVDDAPVVTVSSGSTDALGRTATAVDAGVSVSDPDNASLASATVLITGGFVSGQDVLGFSNSDAARFGNIVSGYDAASGVLSLTSSGSTATVAQFEAALRSVTYLNTSDTPSTAARTIGMSVNDGVLDSAVASRTVSVSEVTPTSHESDVMLIHGAKPASTFSQPDLSDRTKTATSSDDLTLLTGSSINHDSGSPTITENNTSHDGLNTASILLLHTNESEIAHTPKNSLG